MDLLEDLYRAASANLITYNLEALNYRFVHFFEAQVYFLFMNCNVS